MTRDTSKTFKDIVVDIAMRKRDAAAFRKSGKPHGVEESRDVYRNACFPTRWLLRHDYVYLLANR